MPVTRNIGRPQPDRLTAEGRDRLMVLYLHLLEGEFSEAEYDEMLELERATQGPAPSPPAEEKRHT